MSTDRETWVPAACTLPTAERSLRVAEFDELLGAALRRQERPAPTRLRWHLDAGSEPAVRDLVARETGCCSFFTFTIVPTGDAVRVDVEVPAEHAGVLDALAARS